MEHDRARVCPTSTNYTGNNQRLPTTQGTTNFVFRMRTGAEDIAEWWGGVGWNTHCPLTALSVYERSL